MIIIDDHLMVAESLSAALEQHTNFSVKGMSATLRHGLELVEQHQPTVVLLDYDLPDTGVVDGVKALREISTEMAILVISPFCDYEAAARTLEAGAAGYLLKEQRVSELVDAVRLVRDGGHPVAPKLVDAFVARLSRTTTPAHLLSRREIEVLGYLAAGESTAAIAARLQVSVNTIRNHAQSAISRLGAHSRLEAVAIAQREGVIEIGRSRPTMAVPA
ncbi:MAG: response regulator transcription factor [Actinomycetia bacterium]|nr:response regulator transcription factor [Actinomycetes bacterium]